MKNVFSLFLAIVLILGTMALTTLAEDDIYVFEDEDIIRSGELQYKIVGSEAHFYKYLGSEAYVLVPHEIAGYPVTTICKDAFFERDNLQEVFISDGITRIEYSAFNNCNNLKTVTLPSTLTESVADVFYYCSVEKIVINEGMTRVPDAFLASYHEEVEVVLPATVEEIGYRAFNYSYITKINLENVKKINGSAFSDCTYLKEADLRNVEYLGIHAFRESGIESANLQNIKEWIGAEYIDIKEDGKVSVWGQWHHGVHYAYDALCHAPFRKCNNLKTVRIRYPETSYGIYHNLLISECPNIETVVIESLPKSFNKWDFSYDIEDKNPPNAINSVIVPSATAQYGKMPLNMTIYGRGDEVKVYAEGIGVPFKELIDVNLNSERIWMDDCLPYIKNDRTMVPMRAIFEALGATVTWDDGTKTASGVKDGVEVKITIGENVLYKNGEAIELDAAAEITNDRTMVPVRAISEAFDYLVEWDNEVKAVNILDTYRRTYYTYDENGRVIKTQNSDYPYHHEYLYNDNGNVIRELQKTVFKNSDRLFEYTYNEKGQRILKSECKMWYTYALSGYSIESDVPFTEVEKYFYDEDGTLIYAEYPSGERRYYIYDEEGKLIREENEEGETLVKYVYDDGKINYTESY